MHGSRQAAFGGFLPIQMSEILAYCAICGFHEPTVRVDLMRMVQVADDEWLGLENERRAMERLPGGQQRH